MEATQRIHAHDMLARHARPREELNNYRFGDLYQRAINYLEDSFAEDFGFPLVQRLRPRKLFSDGGISDASPPHNQAINNHNNMDNCILPADAIGTTGTRICTRESDRSQRMMLSPPCKRVRSLSLFNSVTSPVSTPIEMSSIETLLPSKSFGLSISKKSRSCGYRNEPKRPTVNVNPFTPSGMLLTRKRTRSKRSPNCLSDVKASKYNLIDSESDNETEAPLDHATFQNSNIPRYHQEFEEIALIGTGEFGLVYKCINRLDGYTYAIKKSIKSMASSINKKNALTEVYAHAVLWKHQHVVRYFSAWTENNHMIIQYEYCNGGNLADAIAHLQQTNKHMPEVDLRQLLLHVVKGLRYIHNMQLVHMDIRPSNIFISKEKSLSPLNCNFADSFDEKTAEEEIIYKIGNLGHVTSINDPRVHEGDSRYLPEEILHKNFTHLPKADIFALGLTIYEAGGGGLLPRNGPSWQEIRNGNLKELPHYNHDFNDLLKLMIHPNPETRLSTESLLQHQVLCPFGNQTKAQLRRELDAAKLKNEILSKQIQQAGYCLKTIASNITLTNTMNAGSNKLRPASTTSSCIKTLNRSKSTVNF